MLSNLFLPSSLFLTILLFVDPTWAHAASHRYSDAATALQRPLIIGASVSSSFKTTSPGERAALRYTDERHITNIAAPLGRAATSYRLTPENAAAYSSIIAVDYLFWDSTSPDPREAIAALHHLVNVAAVARVPLVIGDIPALRPNQISRTVLNQAIHSACRRQLGCYVLPLDSLHRRMLRSGVTIDGKSRHFGEVSEDGLHLNAAGSEYVAGMIIQLLN